MHQLLAAAVLVTEEGGQHEGGAIPPVAWGIGIGTLIIFLLLLLAITRLNLDR